jgi:hypothetical protein
MIWIEQSVKLTKAGSSVTSLEHSPYYFQPLLLPQTENAYLTPKFNRMYSLPNNSWLGDSIPNGSSFKFAQNRIGGGPL